MKVIFLLSYLVAISFATPTFELQWNHFKLTYGKSYKNFEEETKRTEIFNENLRKIEEHNKLYEEGLVSYRKGVNKFSDWTREEYVSYVTKNRTKNRPIELDQEGPFPTSVQSSNVDLPSAIDWRKKKVVTSVKDDKDYWAACCFSVVGAIESHYAIKTGKLIPLSVQQLIDCAEDPVSWNKDGTAFAYAIRNGLTTETDYPYEADEGYCRTNHKRVIVRPLGYRSIIPGNETDLQVAVATAGPVSVYLDTTNFIDYEFGIFTGDCLPIRAALIDNLLVVGYDTDEKGQDYWIVQTSWGPKFGENGYIRLPRGQNKCGIATWATYPVF